MSSNQPQGANDLDFTFRFRDCKRPNEVADLKSAFPPKAVISLRRTKSRFGPNFRREQLQQNGPLFDHLVCEYKQRRWD